MKTAQEIYEGLIHIMQITPTQLCSLHKPCIKVRGCKTEQSHPVLDFDLIKNQWKRQKKQRHTLSVDALTYEKEKIYFIEIKGWKQFLVYQEANDVAIQQQVDSYKLQDKLLDSVVLCEEITGETDILKNMPVVYVLVTDIKVEEQGLESIATNLNLLGSTTTHWETVCNEYMGKKLQEIQQIQTWYITCTELDNLLTSGR